MLLLVQYREWEFTSQRVQLGVAAVGALQGGGVPGSQGRAHALGRRGVEEVGGDHFLHQGPRGKLHTVLRRVD